MARPLRIEYANAIYHVMARGNGSQWSLQLAHYVSLLETKPGLLDSGKPFVKQAWTQSQQLFRSELEFRYQGEGTRSFIDILLLAKKYDWKDVCRVIDACCRNHAFKEQAVLLELQGASDLAGSENNDISQDNQTGIATIVPGARIASSMLEASGNAFGILAISTSMQFGYLPIDRAGAENLFGFFSRCYEQTSVIVTTNLPFAQWPATFANDERMTGALRDRLTHRLEILSINDTQESYRVQQSRKQRQKKN